MLNYENDIEGKEPQDLRVKGKKCFFGLGEPPLSNRGKCRKGKIFKILLGTGRLEDEEDELALLILNSKYMCHNLVRMLHRELRPASWSPAWNL